jgi:hypothetical protein
MRAHPSPWALAVLAVLAAAAQFVPALATTYVVSPDGSGDFETIQDAVEAAKRGDVIELTDGVFHGEGNHDIDMMGRAVTIRSQSGDPAVCLIQAQTDERGFAIDDGEGPDTIIESIGVHGARVAQGAGIYCLGSSPTITGCEFIECRAEQGGGIYCESGDPIVSGCLFRDCWSGVVVGERGGGLYLKETTAAVTGCTFCECGHYGGGISCRAGATPTIADCRFVKCVGRSGCALLCEGDASPVLESCLVESCAVQSYAVRAVRLADQSGLACVECTFRSNHGGAVMLHGGSAASFEGCAFVGNSYGGMGGAVDCTGDAVTFTECLFEGNGPTARGGAVHAVLPASVMFQDCAFAGNSSDYGGAISCSGGEGTLTIDGCTFEGNAASERGASIYLGSTRETVPIISGCTFGTTGGGATETVFCYGSSPSVTSCTFAQYGDPYAFTCDTDVGDQWSGPWPARPSIDHTIIAFGYLMPIECFDLESAPQVTRSVLFGHSLSDTLYCSDHHDNLFVDPAFCGVAQGDFTLCADSPCLPENNPWGELIGAREAGCGACATAVDRSSWGRIKAIYR